MRQETNFGDLPQENCELQSSRVVIVPVPYDGTSTWQKGADKGPAAIIEASANMELYDIETNCEVYEHGIYTADPIETQGSVEQMVRAVRETVQGYLDQNKFTIVIGGEHSVSIGTIQAHANHYNNLTVLQLDAHSDLRDQYQGSKCNHACVMARTKELCPIIQVGIRSMDACELKAIDKSRTFFAEDIHNRSDWMADVVSLLSDNVYVTIDLDVFDPSIMPSTGTPEPGGLLWYDVLKLLKMVAENSNLVGFDVNELCPNDTDKAPDFLAAKLIYKLLSYSFGAYDAKE
ncbi:MAG: agmatinase [Sedimentisphaerales bacterium]|nr:agmatinase [Sedimentisphaerales bacterium]